VDVTLAVVGAGLAGLGLGITLNHFLVSRPLMQRVALMRYVGFMGDPKPEWQPAIQPLNIRED
jgi:hypothetical protein